MKRKLEKVFGKVKKAMEKEESYSFLPEIAQSIEAMIDGIYLDRERRAKMAGALERLVTEDYAFSETSLGEEILKVSDKFAKL